ncbi:iron-sulfur cluster assembly scaffold protein [Phaeovulum vinaykumarii]|uniref:Nitrogen fixation protein NifU n=1 Tax=Phaeovulum vinaykumarii TaxID=407234 RepID=A0A1N7LKJ6_9RHOB|nr:iron-sulfur cluster assembly scaffold protein [Phaeovulum vinaykumarii]SIS74314.1 Modular FeS cluster scaffolding protein NifU [Phaeovulum vinaykumarii]SOC04975.1 modular FeS cluster scaffolding protein NifU [Phaeovulum vinaykumarii]
MQDFSDTLRDHFFNPRNVGTLDGANAVGEAGSIEAGAMLRLMLRVDPQTRRIEDARFQSFGGGAVIASGSALTELVAGRTVDEARALTEDDIDRALGGLPETRRAVCAQGRAALDAALADFGPVRTEAAAMPDPAMPAPDRQPPAYRAALARAQGKPRQMPSGIPMPAAWAEKGAEKGGASQPTATAENPAACRSPGADDARILPATEAQEAIAVARIIEEMRPTFRADGGDVELVDFTGNRVEVHLSGACAGCQLASMTLAGLQARIIKTLGRAVRIVPVGKN